jgi:hypothetical protein
MFFIAKGFAFPLVLHVLNDTKEPPTKDDKSMKKIMLLSAAVLAMQTVPALAQDAAKPKHDGKRHEAKFDKMFDAQDANKDGKVTEAEFLEFQKNIFLKVDGNKDGSVTKEEAKAFGEKRRAEWEAKRKEMKAKKEAEKATVAPAPAQ